jgi:phosphoglycolate phosphatase-like HAD superfamily hydrolase
MRIFCLFLLSAMCFKAEALIVESNEITDVLAYHTKDALFVFDLDNTLIEPEQYLGSDAWFDYNINYLVKQEGLNRNDAVLKLSTLCHKVYDRSKMRLVDPCIPDLLAEIKAKKIPMIGLTKRTSSLARRTLEHIYPLNIDFDCASDLKEDLFLEEVGDTLFQQGIIFVGHGMTKGPALTAYLKRLEKLPKRIVAVDDKLSHVHNIESAIELLGIDFIGIRYGKTDERTKAFNPQIAALQMKYLDAILSDEQALYLLELNP